METTPVVSPVVNLLKSRKFIVGLVGLVLDVLVAAAPGLEPIRTELLTAITTVIGLIIGGIAAEDVAAKLGAKRVEPDTTLVNSNAAESTDARSLPHR